MYKHKFVDRIGGDYKHIEELQYLLYLMSYQNAEKFRCSIERYIFFSINESQCRLSVYLCLAYCCLGVIVIYLHKLTTLTWII